MIEKIKNGIDEEMNDHVGIQRTAVVGCEPLYASVFRYRL